MKECQSLSHTRWDCKYHVVFIPKKRKKRIFGVLRRHLGEIFRELAKHKETQIVARVGTPLCPRGCGSAVGWAELVKPNVYHANLLGFVPQTNLRKCEIGVVINGHREVYVSRATDWPYSTLHRYVRLGWLSADWGSDEKAIEGEFGE